MVQFDLYKSFREKISRRIAPSASRPPVIVSENLLR
jgi:hypothetical protein